MLRHVVAENETIEDLADDYYGTPRRARDIRGREITALRERGWDIDPGWQIDQLEAMTENERNQWVELRFNQGTIEGQVFYVDPEGRTSPGEAFRLP